MPRSIEVELTNPVVPGLAKKGVVNLMENPVAQPNYGALHEEEPVLAGAQPHASIEVVADVPRRLLHGRLGRDANPQIAICTRAKLLIKEAGDIVN